MRQAAVVVAVLALLAGMWVQAMAQAGPAILETGCTDGTAWVMVEGEGRAPYAWYASDQATGGRLLTRSTVDFDQVGVWRVGLSGQSGPALRFEMGDERAYFAVGCVPVAEPVQAPISPLEYRTAEGGEQRLYLPQVGR